MKARSILVPAMLAVILTLSGCGVTDWFYGLGGKMPVHDETKRCHKNFCWNETGQPAQGAAAQGRRLPMEQAGTGAPPLPMGVPGMIPPPGMPPMPGMIPPPPGMAPQRQQEGGMPYLLPVPGQAPEPSNGIFPSIPGQTVPESEQLSPWEANPSWKQEVEPSPYNDLMKSVDEN